MPIVVDLKGFSAMLEKIQEAHGDVNLAASKALEAGIAEAENALRTECASAGVPASVTNAIRVEKSQSGNRYTAKVGWEMGEYDPNNLSQGFKALFLNFGTPKPRTVKTDKLHVNVNGQWVTTGTNRGILVPKGFVASAKKKAKPKMKQAQQAVFDEILEGLK